MDPAEAARQQRIARYKEERRRQLDAQYGRLQDSASSSSSGGGVTIRSTRASRLRSAAVAAVPDGGKTAVTPRRELGSEKKDVNGRLGPPTPSPEVAKEVRSCGDLATGGGEVKVRAGRYHLSF
ncbi:hypothetical protein J6590_022411 [Homalodisca vitripennis]|nr:hypothetical protein J6590_022411 [Homalodisca vitripennis]